jgi:hypothetical protein
MRGKSPRIVTVQEMANILLTKRDKSSTPSTVGKGWPNKFIKRHNKLETKFSHKYNYQQALCEDPEVI